MKCHIAGKNNILSCIYFTSFALQIEILFIIFNSATNAMETKRVKERVFYMSCFDRFTKLKRNDEIEASVQLISFDIWQIFVWPSHKVRSNTLYALNRLIDSYRFFYESSRYLVGFPKAYLFGYYAALWETEHCKYMSQKTIAFWAMCWGTVMCLPMRRNQRVTRTLFW